YPFKVVVLDGLTGVGKTEVLKALAAIGLDVLDLEAIANHRGSIFGGIGLGEQPTQKNFDGYLWERLRTFSGDCVFLEAESRKIGSVRLPEFLMERIKYGARVLL
ncbi:MAG TPA: tRNA 2-selenouridine(34) synthase MnmH, partial [Candidatus Melainabacteria bacterium]|nr:tRNA 2-selenouridine(34) synthase MnmH [Candidatus Melainabacteria bacterium]